ncbi:MAG: hypothetical protein R2857_07525 [Vampirovibrionales bacterium]
MYADFLDQPYIDEQSDLTLSLIGTAAERITEYVEDTLRQSHHDAVAADIYEALFSDADPYCLALMINRSTRPTQPMTKTSGMGGLTTRWTTPIPSTATTGRIGTTWTTG